MPLGKESIKQSNLPAGATKAVKTKPKNLALKEIKLLNLSFEKFYDSYSYLIRYINKLPKDYRASIEGPLECFVDQLKAIGLDLPEIDPHTRCIKVNDPNASAIDQFKFDSETLTALSTQYDTLVKRANTQ